MGLQAIDLIIIGAFFVISLIVGIAVMKRAGKSSSEYFLAGRHMPWWLLGVSMVATTFSTDTPNLVTDLVRTGGVAGNWCWWAFLLTGMLTVFVYAKLWRRTGIMTDIEFYELRYSGKSAAFLRGFRAVYLGVFFNIMVMAMVSLAAIKIGEVMFGLAPWKTLVISSIIVVIYSMLGGLSGVLITDLLQFSIAMFGSIVAAIYALKHPAVGGLSNLLSNPALQGRLSVLPDFSNPEIWIPLFLIPLTVQWWSTWYPGSEPGGGGYIAQRMLSAKNENHAIGATFLFNAAHYALRPWPWIIVALCSMVVFPSIASIQEAFPNANPQFVKHDMAYSAMLKTVLPAGLLGLVVASLIAAFMSTISTHLNWGASYVVNDVYKRFINPQAPEKKLVFVGRISTLILMVLSCLLALALQNAYQAFQILLQIGAGTGLLFILRWFWWRINAFSELTAMIVSFAVAVILQLGNGFGMLKWQQMIFGVAITTTAWIAVSFLVRPTEINRLIDFYRLAKPGGPGWKYVYTKAEALGLSFNQKDKTWDIPIGILCMFFGCLAVYSALFATGFWVYSEIMKAVVFTILAIAATIVLTLIWKKL